jgi:hypothetical protein
MHGCDAGGRLKLRYDLYQTSTSSTHHPHLQSVLTCIQPLPPSRTRGPHLARESHLYFHSLHPPTRYLTFLSFDPQLNLRHQSPTCSSESFNFDKHHSFARIPFAPRTSPCQHPIPLHSNLVASARSFTPSYTSARTCFFDFPLSADHGTLACASITETRQTALRHLPPTLTAH